MRTGSLLCLQSAEGMEPLGAFNQPVYRSYSQLRAALLNDLGTPYADYFARPDFDADAARIGWVAHELGEPRRWIDLSAEEHARLDPVRQKLQDGFAAYRQQLDAAPENSTRGNFGKLLAQALRVPGMQYLYVLGDQPVVAFWGFRTKSNGAFVDPLMIAAGSTTLGGGGGAAAVAETATVVTETVVRRRRGWWWWLLALLLLLLLLTLLWWWLTGPRDGILIEPPVQPNPVTPGPLVPPGPGPGINTNPNLHEPRPYAPDHSDVIPPVHEGTVPVGPEHDGTYQGNQTDNNGTIVTPPCSGPNCGPVNPSGPINNGDQTVPPDQNHPLDHNGPLDHNNLPDQNNPQDHNNPPDQNNPHLANPNPAPDNGTTRGTDRVPNNLPPLPPVQQPGEPVNHGPALKVPPHEAPGPAGFMAGTWRSQSGLMLNGRPAEEYYQFNKDGKGRVVVRSRDGQLECSGAAQATVGPDRQLHVQEAPTLPCNSGGQMPGAVTSCMPSPGNTTCEGTNADGSHFSVRMEKVPQ